MRALRTTGFTFLAAALACGSAWAADSGSASSGSATATKKTDGRDPVAQAFRLPPKTTLSSSQQAAYDDLKSKYEATLREAMDLLKSKDKADQAKGMKLNRETRAQIKAGLKEILSASSSNSASGQQYTGSNSNRGGAQNAGGYRPTGYTGMGNDGPGYGPGPGPGRMTGGGRPSGGGGGCPGGRR